MKIYLTKNIQTFKIKYFYLLLLILNIYNPIKNVIKNIKKVKVNLIVDWVIHRRNLSSLYINLACQIFDLS